MRALVRVSVQVQVNVQACVCVLVQVNIHVINNTYHKTNNMYKLYKFSQYKNAKYDNSIITRFEQMCNYFQDLLGMPVMIAGLHVGFKNAISGVERELRNINPRCVLTIGGLSLDTSAVTSNQEYAIVRSVNDVGVYGSNELPYRRLPLEESFSGTIVMSDAEQAIRMQEYIMMLAFEVPQIPGDEHTRSTFIVDPSSNIDHDTDKNEYRVSFSAKLNMQIIEPMTSPIDDKAYRLVGTGTLLPDGTYDEDTPDGQIIYKQKVGPDGKPIIGPDGKPVYEVDSNGKKIPVTDDDGNILRGSYVYGGWYRLHTRIHVHSHLRWEDCLESDACTHFERQSVAELLGKTSVKMPDCPPVNKPKDSTIVPKDDVES